MLLAIVLIVFALHIVAWMVLPATRSAKAQHTTVSAYRQGNVAIAGGKALDA